ncbi:hypothetical protein TNIN_175441 [Trichonephila inaurata madagascariensis]|uniref:Mutator-like transposase domain-containing protein n=1 Tax=Trichonephila inaurata madagascariensis TaxID=2747483 RepID=A0A8X7CIM6_9ARAC|nr:hypothetical protein TNIN_175441 [Trichonephila inaurata madagascariensis]
MASHFCLFLKVDWFTPSKKPYDEPCFPLNHKPRLPFTVFLAHRSSVIGTVQHVWARRSGFNKKSRKSETKQCYISVSREPAHGCPCIPLCPFSIKVKEVAEKSMKRAAVEENSLSLDNLLTVSGDGAWKTRGHSSLIGVCTVIGAETGKV